MSDPIRTARELRSRAIDARDAGDFAGAEALHEEAIKTLEGAWPEGAPPTDKVVEGSLEQQLAKNLAHNHGALGGTYRAAGEFEDAANAYTDGLAYEADPSGRFGFEDSYNLVQRLVAVTLLDPPALVERMRVKLTRPHGDTETMTFPDDLEAARETIRGQLRGSRRGDDYAQADLALVSLLLDHPDQYEALNDFLDARPDRYAVDATARVVGEILDRIEEYRAGDDDPGRFDPVLERLTIALEFLRG